MRFFSYFFMCVLVSLNACTVFAAEERMDLKFSEDKEVFPPILNPACIQPKSPQVMCLDLNNALAITLESNRNIESAYLNRVLDKYSLYVAQDLFIPDLNIKVAGTRAEEGQGSERFGTDAITASYGISTFLPTGGQVSLEMTTNASRNKNRSFSDFERKASSNINLSFVQPLLRGAGYQVASSPLQTAEIIEKGNILGLKAVLIDTVSETILAYRGYQLELKQLAITKTSLERAKALITTTKSLINAGRLAPMELVQAEMTVAQRKLSFETAKNSVDGARLNLLSVLDIGLDTNLILIEQENLPSFGTATTEYFFDVALQNQPAYLQSLLGLELNEIEVRLAKNNKLWDLDATFSAELDDNTNERFQAGFNNFRRNQVDFQAGLTLTIPFGDRTRRQGVISASVNRHQQQLAIEELKESLKISVHNQVRIVRSLSAQLILARQSEVLAERQLATESIRLNLGRSTNFRVIDFEDRLILAELDTAAIATAYLNALTELDRLLGTSLEVWNISFQAQRYNIHKHIK